MKECNDQKIKAIYFFKGGGMICGLRKSGIDVIARADFDGNAKYYLITNSKMI